MPTCRVRRRSRRTRDARRAFNPNQQSGSRGSRGEMRLQIIEARTRERERQRATCNGHGDVAAGRCEARIRQSPIGAIGLEYDIDGAVCRKPSIAHADELAAIIDVLNVCRNRDGTTNRQVHLCVDRRTRESRQHGSWARC